MSDKLAGGIAAGSTSYTSNFILRSSTDGAEMIGKIAANITAYYIRQGGLPVQITLSDLAAVNSAYSSGGVKELDAINMKGSYRIDLPDLMLATGADWAELDVFCAGSEVFKERFALQSSVLTVAQAIAGKTAQMVFTNANKLDSAVLAAGDFAQGAADKVWASATRSLTTFGTLVTDIVSGVWGAGTRALTSIGNIVSGVLDEAIAGHLAPGSVGARIDAAAAAADPWGATLPGSYTGSEAGAILAGLGGDSGTIDQIAAKVSGLTYSQANRVDATVISAPGDVVGIQRNQPLPDFTFVMLDLSGSPKSGLTNITAERKLDSGNFDPCANLPTEDPEGDGVYIIDLAASDLDGKVVTMKFQASGCKPRIFTIITEP